MLLSALWFWTAINQQQASPTHNSPAFMTTKIANETILNVRCAILSNFTKQLLTKKAGNIAGKKEQYCDM